MPAIKPLRILKASAGSGKTFSLAVHFVALLLTNENSYREVLALTFTNKATAEMKSRILEVLEGLARDEDSGNIKAYRQQLLTLFPAWQPTDIQQKAHQVYRKILHDYSHFTVSTIDGFSQKVIRSFAYELGLDGLYRIEMNTEKVRRDLIKKLYNQLNENPHLFNWVIDRILNNIDLDKSWDINRGLYMLSGIIFSEDFQYFDQVIDRFDEQQLFKELATYNRDYLRGFKEKYQHYIDRITDIFKASGVTSDDLYRKGQNFLPQFNFYRETLDELGKITGRVDRFANNIETYQSEKNRTAPVVQLYEALNPTMLAFQEFLVQEAPSYHLVQAVEANLYYLRLMKQMSVQLSDWRSENNAQLISDAQRLLSKIGLTDQGDPTFVWEKIGNRYKYFLFDEFQDTSNNQWNNLFPLLANALSTSSGKLGEHLVVGDVKQSIYRWRNGDWRILLEGIERDVKRVFNLNDIGSIIEKDTLGFNFRSDRNIVDFNNFVYKHLPSAMQNLLNERVEAAIGEAGYQQHWMAKGFHDAIVRAYEGATQHVPPEKQDILSGNIEIEYLPAKELDVETNKEKALSSTEIKRLACEKIYDKIVEWLQNGSYTAKDIGILVRENKEARLLIDYFDYRQREGGNVFQVISGDALLLANNVAVKTIVDTLRFMTNENPHYSSYLANMVFYYNQWKGNTLSNADWLNIPHVDMGLLQGSLPANLATEWNTFKQLPLVELVERLIDSYGFGQDAALLPYLLAFRDLVSRFTATGDTGLSSFLDYWEEESARASLPAQKKSNAVEIITIHKSKGLDFTAVMIPFCSWSLDGRPASQVWFDMQDTPYKALEKMPLKYDSKTKHSSIYPQYYEEMLYNYMDALNYLYVASTRTKKHLYLLAPEHTPNKNGECNPIKIGDVLMHVLSEYPQGITQTDPLKIQIEGQKAAQSGDDKKDKPEVDDISLSHYPASPVLKTLLNKQENLSAELIHKLAQSAAFSNTIHELMAGIRTPHDITSTVDWYVEEGKINTADREIVENRIRSAWNHPELGNMLNGDYEQLNEQPIIDREGKTWRPDKVLFNTEETIIIDFKMTSVMKAQDHLRQVKTYQQHLQELGHPHVRGYVYYFGQEKLVEVN